MNIISGDVQKLTGKCEIISRLIINETGLHVKMTGELLLRKQRLEFLSCSPEKSNRKHIETTTCLSAL